MIILQYLMLVAASVLLAVNFSANKVYQNQNGASPKSALGFNSLLGLSTAAVFFIMNGFNLSFTPYSFVMTAIMNTLVMLYVLIGFKLLKSGGVTLYTLFLMTGGMTVPYVYGLVFLNEPFVPIGVAGLVLIIAGVVLSNFGGEKINKEQILLCVSIFFLNGFVSVVSKLHQIEEIRPTISSVEFVIIGGMFKFVLAGILYFFVNNGNNEERPNPKNWQGIVLIVISAAVGGVSYILQLNGARDIDATVLYPFITGGSIIFSAFAGRIFFKEKLSKKLILSIALCFIGTILFL